MPMVYFYLKDDQYVKLISIERKGVKRTPLLRKIVAKFLDSITEDMTPEQIYELAENISFRHRGLTENQPPKNVGQPPKAIINPKLIKEDET